MQSIVFAMLVLLGLAATVCAEPCTTNPDCTATQCSAGFLVICEHPAGAGTLPNGGLCTCAQDNLYCTTRDQCLASNPLVVLPCGDGRRHCYDNRCICSRFNAK